MNDPTASPPPDASAALLVADHLRSFVCKTPEDYARGGEEVRILDEYIVKARAHYAPIKKSAFETHRKICEAEAARVGPVEMLSKAIKRAMLDWKRREEADAARLAREEQERLRQREEDRQIERAVSLESQGQKEEAEKTLDRPTLVPLVVAPAPVAPKLEGIRVSKVWTAEVENLPLYLSWIGAWTAPMEEPPVTPPAHAEAVREFCRRTKAEDLVDVKLEPIRKLARETEGEVTIPGLRIFQEERLAKR